MLASDEEHFFHPTLGRPQLLNFPPYDKDQLVAILEQKLPSLLSLGLTFEPSAVQFCARKVSSVHGDLRKAVDICRRSVEALEARRRQDKGRLRVMLDRGKHRVVLGGEWPVMVQWRRLQV